MNAYAEEFNKSFDHTMGFFGWMSGILAPFVILAVIILLIMSAFYRIFVWPNEKKDKDEPL